MAYFKTSYDASSTTLSIDDEQVARALGVLADKTPAADRKSTRLNSSHNVISRMPSSA